jgi:hypothetical protein
MKIASCAKTMKIIIVNKPLGLMKPTTLLIFFLFQNNQFSLFKPKTITVTQTQYLICLKLFFIHLVKKKVRKTTPIPIII